MQFHSFIEFKSSFPPLVILSKWVCFSPITMALLYRHRRWSSFSFFSLVSSLPTSVTTCSDCCLHRNFFSEQSYCRHISSRGPAVSHHFQCCAGNSGTPLDISGGRGIRRYIYVGGGGTMLCHILLSIQRHDIFHQTRVASGGVQHPWWVVRKGSALNQYREYGRDALPPMPYLPDPVGRSLQASDDKVRSHLPGQSEATGSVLRIWSGPGSEELSLVVSIPVVMVVTSFHPSVSPLIDTSLSFSSVCLFLQKLSWMSGGRQG